MTAFCKRVTTSDFFLSLILALIVVNAIFMGLETVPAIGDTYTGFFEIFSLISQIIFIAEIILRIGACLPEWRSFFKYFWNSFDFMVVALSLLPMVGPFALVARLLRVLRVLRLVSSSDHLRKFVERLSDAFDEIAFSSLVTAVLGYIFSLSGYYLFSEIDPGHWGGLGKAGLSVFYLLLLQDVGGIVAPLVQAHAAHIFYFLLFYVVWFGLVLSVVAAAISQSTQESKGEKRD
jgi:voltage-gated sodium channel